MPEITEAQLQGQPGFLQHGLEPSAQGGIVPDAAVGLGNTRLEARQLSGVGDAGAAGSPLRVSMDTQNPQSFNLYAYARSDPINSSDPTGLLTFTLCGPGCSIALVALIPIMAPRWYVSKCA